MGLRDQWYENAVFYCLAVETYTDSGGDGTGGFTGLTRRWRSSESSVFISIAAT
jgi:maltose alpha-D-glucosyltransferase/alpha-amylase